MKILLGLLISTYLMASNNNEALDYIGEIGVQGAETTLSLLSLALMLIGWAIILGAAFGSYSISYKKMKEIDDQDRSGGVSSSMTRLKAVGAGLLGAIGGSILLTVIFTKVIPLADNSGDALREVLQIDAVMKE